MNQSANQNSSLESLAVLVGGCKIEITSMSFYDDPSAVAGGHTSFDWLEGVKEKYYG